MQQNELAKLLEISPAMVSRLTKRGMPTDTLERAQRWRKRHLEPGRVKGSRFDANQLTKPIDTKLATTAPNGVAQPGEFAAKNEAVGIELDATPTENSGSSYQNARAIKEKFLALEAERAYRVAICELRNAKEVESLVAGAMTEIRLRLQNLGTSLAPVLAAQNDEATVRAILDDAVDQTLRSAAQHFGALAAASK